MAWLFDGKEVHNIDIDKYPAMVYCITDLTTDRKYIGKKYLKHRKGKGWKESDWRDYWSSSKELQERVWELGTDKFTREIIYLCGNRGSSGYLEAKLQIMLGVLEQPEKFFNGYVSYRFNKTHIKMEGVRKSKQNSLGI